MVFILLLLLHNTTQRSAVRCIQFGTAASATIRDVEDDQLEYQKENKRDSQRLFEFTAATTTTMKKVNLKCQSSKSLEERKWKKCKT